MKRRDFIQAVVGAITVAVVPLPLKAELPAPTPPFKKRIYGGNRTIGISPEDYAAIRNWGVDQIDEQTRKELFSNGDIKRMVSARVHTCS